jgi:ribosomal protein S21
MRGLPAAFLSRVDVALRRLQAAMAREGELFSRRHDSTTLEDFETRPERSELAKRERSGERLSEVTE